MNIDWTGVCNYLEVRDAETARRLAFERIMAKKRIDADRRGIPLDELLADEQERKEAVFKRFVRNMR